MTTPLCGGRCIHNHSNHKSLRVACRVVGGQRANLTRSDESGKLFYQEWKGPSGG